MKNFIHTLFTKSLPLLLTFGITLLCLTGTGTINFPTPFFSGSAICSAAASTDDNIPTKLQQADKTLLKLQILTINDFHGALTEKGANPGAAKLAQFINEIKASAPTSTILLSAGDMFQGTPDSNLLAGKPVVEMMNYLAFDAMALGNHEFDWGLPILQQRINQSHFPYLCANVLVSSSKQPLPFLTPYTIVERQGVKIGIIGLATPETMVKTNPKMIAGLSFTDPSKAIQALLPELKAQGAEIIIVVSHLGSWQDDNGNISGEAAVLAAETTGIDAIVSAHTHKLVSGKVNNIPIIQAAYNGRAVGKIELSYNRVTGQVEDSTTQLLLLPYPGLTPDLTMQKLLIDVQQEVQPLKNILVGQTAQALSHDRSAKTQTLLGEWVTDAMRQATGADVAFQNMGGLRNGLPSGNITMGDLYEIMPFDNTVFTVNMTGSQILQVLNYGLMNSKSGTIQFSGLNVYYNPNAEQPLLTVTLANGAQLQPGKNYKVTLNDFLAVGGDGFTMFKEGTALHDSNILLRDLLANNLRQQKVLHFDGDQRLKIITNTKQQHKDAA